MDENDRPDPQYLRIAPGALDTVLDGFASVGAEIGDVPERTEPLTFDLRYLLEEDYDFEPTEHRGYVDLVELYRDADWVDLDDETLYDDENGRLEFSTFLAGSGFGSTPTNVTEELTPGRRKDLLAYVPMPFDWERDTGHPAVFVTPDGIAGTFDAQTEDDVEAVLTLTMEHALESAASGSATETDVASTDRIHRFEDDACPECGDSLAGTENYCPTCGHELRPAACPDCGADLDGDENFCPGCGTAVA